MPIMTFSDFGAHREPFFQKSKSLKFLDSIAINNSLFLYDFPYYNLPLSFSEKFFKTDNLSEYSTRKGISGEPSTPQYKTATFRLKCKYKR